MTALIAVLRMLLPLVIIIVIMRFVLPRLRGSGQQRSDRIDVDATVVKSEPHKVNLDDYEPSEVYVKRQPSDDTESQPSDTRD